jgi:hypothetical protein
MLCLSMIRTADNLRADAELATDPVASTADRTSPPPPALASPTIHGRHVAIRPDGN